MGVGVGEEEGVVRSPGSEDKVLGPGRRLLLVQISVLECSWVGHVEFERPWESRLES